MKYLQKIQYKLVREEVSEYHTRQMKESRDVYNWFKYLGDSEKEKFIVLCLDVKHKVVCFDMIGIGGITQCEIHPREVIKAAILSNASAIILIHNHPSGDCFPSQQDRKLTQMLKGACTVFNITVLDHIVIGHNEYYSLKEDTKTEIR